MTGRRASGESAGVRFAPTPGPKGMTARREAVIAIAGYAVVVFALSLTGRARGCSGEWAALPAGMAR